MPTKIFTIKELRQEASKRPITVWTGNTEGGFANFPLVCIEARLKVDKLNIIYGADKKTYNAIGFGLGNKMKFIQNNFDIAYSLDENEWNGRTSLQLLLKDIKKPL